MGKHEKNKGGEHKGENVKGKGTIKGNEPRVEVTGS